MKRYFYFIVATLILQSCDGTINKDMSRAESFMQDKPDSALLIIEQLNTEKLRTRKNKARYALLYSQALDKNYIDITNDSLARVAVDYYREHGTPHELFSSLYYLGRVQYNAGNYIQSMLSYMEAENLVESLHDDYMAGLLYSEMGQVYTRQYDYTNSLNMAQRAYEYFTAAGLETHRNYALLDMGLAYSNQYQYDKSSEVFQEVITKAKESRDTTLWAEGLSNYTLQLLAVDEHIKAQYLLQEMTSTLRQPLGLQDWASLAYINAIGQKADDAHSCMEQAWNLAETDLDSVALHFRTYQIYYLQKRYEEAIAHFSKVFKATDSIAQQLFQHSTVSAQRDYYQRQTEFAEYKLESERKTHLLIVACLIISIITVVGYLRYRLQLKSAEVERYIQMACEVRETMQQGNTEASRLIQKLFKDKFELIDKLGCTYYERQNTPTEQEAIYNDVKKAILDLGNNKRSKVELENIINVCNDDILQKLKMQLPQLKEADYLLFCYLCAGFSNRAISIFLQDKIENIYNRKSRLRNKISNSDAVDKELFLGAMS